MNGFLGFALTFLAFILLIKWMVASLSNGHLCLPSFELIRRPLRFNMSKGWLRRALDFRITTGSISRVLAYQINLPFEISLPGTQQKDDPLEWMVMDGVNPATGLPMRYGVDSSGNAFGTGGMEISTHHHLDSSYSLLGRRDD